MAENNINCTRTVFDNPQDAPWAVLSGITAGTGMVVTVVGSTVTLSVDFDAILTDGTNILLDANGNVLTA